MGRHFKIILGFLAVAIGAEAHAESPNLSLPLECDPGKTCWISNYVDVDKAKGKKSDYRCGWRTYDKHRGVDFGIRDLGLMEKGVSVFAAASGKVLGLRDGMADISLGDLKNPLSIRKRECGNGVQIRHANGWSTRYCHMKKGSVLVKKGDVVQRGQVIGQIGLSGKTEFPHLHFSVLKGKEIIDPFQGIVSTGNCNEKGQPLWEQGAVAGFEYGPVIYNIGFSASKPKPKAIRKGLYQDKVLGRNSPALIVWADLFGVAKGDKVEFKIIDPSQEVIMTYSATTKRNKARQMLYAGKPKKKKFWDEGTYIGIIKVTANPGTSEEKTSTVTRKVEIR
ncbi:MAG: M23 family metallopeptidase [Rhodospirillales bacterium]|nr:M23 family metallopeptidase [Rhodospirillales bacterium]